MTADVTGVRMIRSKPEDFPIAITTYEVIKIPLDIDGPGRIRKIAWRS